MSQALIASEVNASDVIGGRPVGSDAVTVFLSAAVKSLGHRSDADLARMLGVPAPTFSSWKRRGSIPDEQWRWFEQQLIGKIARLHPDIPQVSRTARSAVVELLVRTEGNPLGVERFSVLNTSEALGGLFALAEFFATVQGIPPELLISKHVSKVADALESAMPRFRAAAQITPEDLSQ